MIRFALSLGDMRRQQKLISAAFLCLLWMSCGTEAYAQRANAIAPVRAGDQVEVRWGSTWYSGEVLSFQEAAGVAEVRYKWGSIPSTGKFKLADMRFPNDEGPWMVWSDATGKFRIEARLIKADETNVTLRKEDGTEIQVPIEKLSKGLQKELLKVQKATKKLHEESPVRVGDDVEVKISWTWFPARVVKVLPGGALLEHAGWTGGVEQREHKYDAMRYPNGEGPWREWVDATGQHKIFGRYLTHDETHVELLKEDKSRARLERNKLSAKLQKELNGATIFTRRPDEVEFQLSGKNGTAESSWMNFGKGLAEFKGDDFRFGPSEPVQLPEGGFEFLIGDAESVSLVEAIGGESGLVAIGVHDSGRKAEAPGRIYWASIRDRKAIPGPAFMTDEVPLAYSAREQRLLTAEVRGVWSTPVRFCTYKLALGGKIAKPELKWSVPQASFATSSSATHVKFLSGDRILIGFGSSVGLWNLSTQRMEYVVPSSDNMMNLSPDDKYFITKQFTEAVVVETFTGQPVARVSQGGNAYFSQDGRYLIAEGWSMHVNDLQSGDKSIAMPARDHFGKREDDTFSLVADGWLSNGARLWNLERKLLAWSFVGANQEMELRHTAAIGDKLFAVGTRGAESQKSVLLGVAKIPHAAPVNALSAITDDQLYVLRPGARVRIDSAVTEPRILNGIQRAINEAGWVVDPSSDIEVTGSAGPGKTETRTYESSRYGFSSRGGDYQQTISVTPWIQSVIVRQGNVHLWQTGGGGVPSMVMLKEGESLQNEVNKSSQPSYHVFENFNFPERVMAPKYAGGLGKSLITPGGLVDQLVP